MGYGAGMSRSCPICASATRPYQVPETNTPEALVICEACRHITWAGTPSSAELAAYYATRYASDHNQRDLQEQGRAYYADHAQELLQKYRIFGGTKDKPVLADFGCAWPVFLEEADKTEAYGALIGVDYETATLNRGRTLGFAMATPDAFFDTQKPGSIDIIRFSHVIEHTIDPVSLLQKLLRVMADDGLVYITQPTFPVMKPDTPPRTIKDSVYPEHLHFFNPLSLSNALKQAGFAVVELAAFQDEIALAALYRDSLDKAYATRKLKALRNLTPTVFQVYGGYPDFIGENMFVYAAKRKSALMRTIRRVAGAVRRRLSSSS